MLQDAWRPVYEYVVDKELSHCILAVQDDKTNISPIFQSKEIIDQVMKTLECITLHDWMEYNLPLSYESE